MGKADFLLKSASLMAATLSRTLGSEVSSNSRRALIEALLAARRVAYFSSVDPEAAWARVATSETFSRAKESQSDC